MKKSPAARLSDDLESAIRAGDLRLGEKLSGEEALAARYGLSRPAVREALQTLKARGLITSRRGSGSYVSTDSGARSLSASLELYSALRRDGSAFLELLDLRLLLECSCVEALAKPGACAARQALREQLAVMEKAVGSPKTFGKADITFHLILVEAAGNDLFTTIMRGLLATVGLRFAKKTYIEADLPLRILAEHREVCEHLDAGRATAARRSLRRHLESSRAHLLALLQAAQSA